LDKPYKYHHKRKYRTPSHYRHTRKNVDRRYHSRRHISPHKYRSPQSYRSFRGGRQGGMRVNARHTGQMGRSHSRGGSRGLRR
jgi:hypothetical protein